MAIRPTLIAPEIGHRLWAATYDEDLNPLLSLEQRVLLPRLPNLEGKTVIDVGCGTGRWTSFVAASRSRVLGFDLTAEMLAIASGKPGLSGRLICATAGSLPLPGSVADVLICSFCVSYVPDLTQALREFARVTQSGGRIFISDLHPSAIASGWCRTFRSFGEIFEMEIEERADDAIFSAGARAGLTPVQSIEPHLGDPEREFFEISGKTDVFESVCRPPALLITEWTQ